MRRPIVPNLEPIRNPGWPTKKRRNLYRTVVEWLERDGVLSPGWDLEAARDILWALTSWQLWELLVVDQGWSKEHYLQHLRKMLRRTLVDSPE